MGKKTKYWPQVFSSGIILLGFALAAPVKMNLYFSDKPIIDITVDVLLLSSVFFVVLRSLRDRGRWLIYLLPLLSLFWLPFEYMAYAKSEWLATISYLLIIWWGTTLSVLYRFGKSIMSNKRMLWAIPTLLVGLIAGLYAGPKFISLFLSILFIVLVGYDAPAMGKRKLIPAGAVFLIIPVLCFIVYLLPEIVYFDSQKKHHDKVVFSQQTRFQRLDVTEWKNEYWFYQDDINHFSSIDSWLYYEPFVHPAMQLAGNNSRILIIGGENGMLANALRQYDLTSVDMLPIDWEYLEIARTNRFYKAQNQGVFDTLSINVIAHSSFRWLSKSKAAYDVVFVDVPDPVDIELNQYYTREFYQLAHEALSENGVIITQSGSPYFATAAFQSIGKTMEAAGFSVIPFHNQVLSLGEWGWNLGAKSPMNLEKALLEQTFEDIDTEWLNREAIQMMLSFGKPYVLVDEAAVNTIENPVIHRLYNQGNYQLN